MSYATFEFYKNVYLGESVDETDFSSLLSRAEEIIEEMTVYRLNATSFERMSEYTKSIVQRAICAQVEYLDANGGSDMDNGSDLQSAGLGKFSYTKSSGSDGSSKQSIYSPRAQRILMPTGLLYRGGDCY